MIVNINDLDKFASDILKEFCNYKIFVLKGEMGAGKTTFTKAFCKSLGINDNVDSPTFAIANVYYSTTKGEVYHFDFYRLNKPSEAIEIGFEDYIYSGNYCLIEWADIVLEYLPKPYVVIDIKHINKIDDREICCSIVEN